MTDFILHLKNDPPVGLKSALSSIHMGDPPEVKEFYGSWGALVVSRAMYNGFSPFEDEQYICVIIGGPVLTFQNNDFLTGSVDSSKACASVLGRWLAGEMVWDEDLSGPFVVLIVNKHNNEITLITDLMLFIPVYYCENKRGVTISTHVDALARCLGESSAIDAASVADFVLHGIVTFPYTLYSRIKLCEPASTYRYRSGAESPMQFGDQARPFWVPREENVYSNINDAAEDLRDGIVEYITSVTDSMDTVAQFISAGEDSRVIAGILPRRLRRDGYIFVDQINRESLIAEKVAKRYGLSFQVGLRRDNHYAQILPEATALVGSCQQYRHAHSLGFHRKFDLASYSAVFGGYLSDSIVKARFSRFIRGAGRLPFIPQIPLKGESRSNVIKSSVFDSQLLDEVTERRRSHLQRVATFRKKSCHEWFVLWPMTMRSGISNLHSNRRLFRTYEPFMANRSVKVGATVPVEWKVNRRLFLAAFRPFLRRTRWLQRADGQFPYMNWWANIPFGAMTWVSREVLRKLDLENGNQGPWGDWKSTVDSMSAAGISYDCFASSAAADEIKVLIQKAIESDACLSPSQKMNLFQVRFIIARAIDEK